MSAPWKTKKPQSLTKKAIHAALQAQRPLDQDAAVLARKKPRKFVSDGVDDVGEK